MKRRFCSTLAALVAVAALLFPASAVLQASEIGSLREALLRAERVLVVEVVSSESRETPAGNIFTYTDFRVLDRMKGEVPATFSTRILGGEVGIRRVNPGLPSFRPGQRYVLLAGPDNSFGYVTLGSFALPVRLNPNSGQWVVEGPVSIPLFRRSTGTPYSSSPAEIPLDDFVLSVKRLLANNR